MGVIGILKTIIICLESLRTPNNKLKFNICLQQNLIMNFQKYIFVYIINVLLPLNFRLRLPPGWFDWQDM